MDRESMNSEPKLHLYVLLDRSGSMAPMAADVIGAFNQLLAEQQAEGADAVMTFVQFDTAEPQEILTDAVPIIEVTPLTEATFMPRGGTPLLDATGLLLGKARTRADIRAAQGQPAESIVFATITDGHENASSEFTKATVAGLVAARQADGWSFVYLGADVAAYDEAGGIGYDHRSVQQFRPDGTGAGVAFASLSKGVTTRRQKLRRGEAFETGDFFEGDKSAEDDRRRRGS